ncbi:SDR family NAD(P)-dependent oxidoreductase [Dactylosporangium sp. NPDC051485]|uniref:SDR family NAD(P)-dependent oxidoreductase n=1 Tax=Dactylosporangium sp. NPDC051485 TaxID=3154846 RepID=UPI003443BC39
MATSSATTALVTGASGGLGKATVHALARAGVRVLVHARTEERAVAAARELHGVPVWADLGSVAGVRGLAEQVTAVAEGGLHVLVNNAGGAAARRDLSPEGVERTIAVHHVASAALTALLLPMLRRGAIASARPARVVNVSSTVERLGRRLTDWSYPERFSQWHAYCDAKLLNLAFTYALAHRLDHREITVNAANPGNVATGFGRNGGAFRFFQGSARFLLSSPERGASTAVRLASDPTLDTATGGYYTKGRPVLSSAASRDPAYGEQVLAMTARLLARSGVGPDPFAGRAG